MLYVVNELVKFILKEFDFIVLLFVNLERVYIWEDLLDFVWGMDYVGGICMVDIYM